MNENSFFGQNAFFSRAFSTKKIAIFLLIFDEILSAFPQRILENDRSVEATRIGKDDLFIVGIFWIFTHGAPYSRNRPFPQRSCDLYGLL